MEKIPWVALWWCGVNFQIVNFRKIMQNRHSEILQNFVISEKSRISPFLQNCKIFTKLKEKLFKKFGIQYFAEIEITDP